MSNKLYLSFIISFFLFLSTGCQKASINGDLDGRWQIMEIEAGDEYSNVKDEQLYYNFNLHVCTLSTYGTNYTSGNMKYGNKELWLQFPYIHTPTGYENLKKYGIFSNPVTFFVEYIDKNKLILKEEGDVIITLRKF